MWLQVWLSTQHVSSMQLFNESLTPCDQSPGPGFEACSCTDCQSSCSPPDLRPFVLARWPHLDLVLTVALAGAFVAVSALAVVLVNREATEEATAQPLSSEAEKANWAWAYAR